MNHNPQRTTKPSLWLMVPLRLLQAFIGLILLATALGKSLDIPGFADVVGTYQVLPEWSWMLVAVGMTGFEWVLGAWLLSGRKLTQAALVSAALHTAFFGWASLALYRGLELSNCGCFGVFLARPLTTATLWEDGFMVGFSLALALLARLHTCSMTQPALSS
ncbi:MAG: MauE/DoxX family redox-associated membrane protein [Bradymonadia bacterium]